MTGRAFLRALAGLAAAAGLSRYAPAVKAAEPEGRQLQAEIGYVMEYRVMRFDETGRLVSVSPAMIPTANG